MISPSTPLQQIVSEKIEPFCNISQTLQTINTTSPPATPSIVLYRMEQPFYQPAKNRFAGILNHSLDELLTFSQHPFNGSKTHLQSLFRAFQEFFFNSSGAIYRFVPGTVPSPITEQFQLGYRDGCPVWFQNSLQVKLQEVIEARGYFRWVMGAVLPVITVVITVLLQECYYCYSDCYRSVTGAVVSKKKAPHFCEADSFVMAVFQGSYRDSLFSPERDSGCAGIQFFIPTQ